MNIPWNRYAATTAHRTFPVVMTILMSSSMDKPIISTKTNSRGDNSSIPSRFGRSIIQQQRSYSSVNYSPNVRDDKDNDCPLCKKYSQGPCGKLFIKWLECTDRYRDDKNNDITKMCQSLAEPLAECLQKERKYYESLDIYTEEDEKDIENLKKSWIDVIKEVEVCHPTTKAFTTAPIMEMRPQNRTGMAGFDYTIEEEMKIVLAYVRDNDTGEIVAAGSAEDLWEYNNDDDGNKKGILRLSFGPECKSVTAYALYQSKNEDDKNNNNDILYKYVTHLSS